jgi:hypothetical protein
MYILKQARSLASGSEIPSATNTTVVMEEAISKKIRLTAMSVGVVMTCPNREPLNPPLENDSPGVLT